MQDSTIPHGQITDQSPKTLAEWFEMQRSGADGFRSWNQLAHAVPCKYSTLTAIARGKTPRNGRIPKRLFEMTGIHVLERRATEQRLKLGRDPQTLREWWDAQTQFMCLADFAAAVDVWLTTLHYWLNGTKEPEHKHRKKLFEITGLPCYGGFASYAGDTPEFKQRKSRFNIPKDLPQAFLNLLPQVDSYIAALDISQNQSGMLFRFFIRCFQQLGQKGVLSPETITPNVLLDNQPTHWIVRDKSGQRKQPWALGHVGKFLAANGYWTSKALRKWRDSVRSIRTAIALNTLIAKQKKAAGGKKGGKKLGYIDPETADRILLAAALEYEGTTKTYRMAPILYPFGPRRDRAASESATRKLRTRNAYAISEKRAALNDYSAKTIIGTIHPQ